jgi:hypothetical protein
VTWARAASEANNEQPAIRYKKGNFTAKFISQEAALFQSNNPAAI